MIRILVVDDHKFVRSGVCGVLREADDFAVVGECSEGAELIPTVLHTQPDVVLMDVRMPSRSGFDATRDLLTEVSTVRVIMLTGCMSGPWLSEAAQVGAVGYLLKGDEPPTLLAAIRTVAAGGTAWPPADAIGISASSRVESG
jgi:DNA-binding NarL/FixJ family response regulator